MRTWQIQSFRRNNGTIYERLADDQNVYGAGTQRMNGMQFMCNGDFTIHSIVRGAVRGATDHRANPVTFTVGDRIGNTGRVRIASFIPLTTDQVDVVVEGGTRHNLMQMYPYVEPTARAIPAPNPNGPRRGTTVAAATATEAAPTTARNVEFFTELQARILAANPREIRLANTWRSAARRNNQNLQQFLEEFFRTYNRERETIYVDNEAQQTSVNRRRSIGDIFMLCRYYYPQCTLRDVYNLLMNVLPTSLSDAAGAFRSSYCSTINKYVWYYTVGGQANCTNTDTRAEWGYTYVEIKRQL